MVPNERASDANLFLLSIFLFPSSCTHVRILAPAHTRNARAQVVQGCVRAHQKRYGDVKTQLGMGPSLLNNCQV